MKNLKTLTTKCALVAGLFAVPAVGAQAATIIGNETSVTVTAFDALTELGLTITPTGTATVDIGDDGLPVATFGITGGTVDDDTGFASILHEGSGLLFSAGDVSVNFFDFVINTETSILTSSVSMNGGAVGSLELFSFDSDLNLFLTDAAAGGLTMAFGAPDLSGVQFGTASVDLVTAVPEPATWMALIFGFGAIGGAMRYRRKTGLVTTG